MLAVKSRLGEKHFIINEKIIFKPVASASFHDYSVSKERIEANHKDAEKIRNGKTLSNMKQLKTFAGLANFKDEWYQIFLENC